MSLTVDMSVASSEPVGDASLDRPSRYTVLSKLGRGSRAEVLLGLPRDADVLEKLVVIKSFYACHPRALALLTEELELASRLDHDNIACTSSIGFESGRYFAVSEYLEGTTLSTLLSWAALADQRLPDAALLRILLALVDAVEHANRVTESETEQLLVNQAVAAADVFVTYDGKVKILGFKSSLRHDGTPRPTGDAAAIDALLSTQLTPKLGAVLAGLTADGAPPGERLVRLRGALHQWQTQALGSDGREDLQTIMSGVLPGARVKQRAILQKALEDALRERPQTARNSQVRDQAPVSGYRERTAAGGSSAGPLVGQSGQLMALVPAPVAREGLRLAQREPGAAAVEARATGHRFRQIWLVIAFACIGGCIGIAIPAVVDAGQRILGLRDSGASPPAGETLGQVDGEFEGGGASGGASLPTPSPLEPPQERTELAASEPRAVAAEAIPSREARDLPLARLTRAPSKKPRVRHGAAPMPPRVGFLTLDTTPWSMVWLGATLLGQTPLVAAELPAGDHVLDLENPELGVNSRYLVSIRRGETTARRVGLEQPSHAELP